MKANVTFGCVAIILLGIGCKRSGTENLILSEVHRFSVPREFSVSGAAMRDSALVVWGAGSGSVMIGRIGSTLHRVGDNVFVRTLSATFISNKELEILDVGLGELVRISADGDVTLRTRLRDAMNFESAIRVEDKWWVIASTPNAGRRLGTLRSCDQSLCFIPHEGNQLPERTDGAFLNADGHGIIGVFLNSPFTAFKANQSRSFGIEVFPLKMKAAQGRWVGLTMLSVGDRYVWTVADLESNSREVVILDSNGRILRRTKIEDPLAFVAADPTKSRLAMVRQNSDFTLILYDWRWSDTGSSTSQ
jgi:hypothetical protein